MCNLIKDKLEIKWHYFSIIDALGRCTKRGNSCHCHLDGQARIVMEGESGAHDSNEEENKFRFEVDITPSGGPYQGGTFRFEVTTRMSLETISIYNVHVKQAVHSSGPKIPLKKFFFSVSSAKIPFKM